MTILFYKSIANNSDESKLKFKCYNTPLQNIDKFLLEKREKSEFLILVF